MKKKQQQIEVRVERKNEREVSGDSSQQQCQKAACSTKEKK
jgi:hypothetical protein